MPWSTKKKGYKLMSLSKKSNSQGLNVGTYTQVKNTPSHSSSNSSSSVASLPNTNTSLVSSLLKQPNTRKLKKLL